MTSQPASEKRVCSPTCGWRTGVHPCRMLRGTKTYCLFHSHWARLVEVRQLDRPQAEEFAVWWEQFQPWGIYGDRPGPWWASVAALWPALRGVADPPRLTSMLENELCLRRAEVSRYQRGICWDRDPWPRVSGEPLPEWIAAEWQAKAAQRRHDSGTQEVA